MARPPPRPSRHRRGHTAPAHGHAGRRAPARAHGAAATATSGSKDCPRDAVVDGRTMTSPAARSSRSGAARPKSSWVDAKVAPLMLPPTFVRRLPKAGSGARSETLPVMTCVAAAATTGHAVPVVIACRARSKCREFSQCSAAPFMGRVIAQDRTSGARVVRKGCQERLRQRAARAGAVVGRTTRLRQAIA